MLARVTVMYSSGPAYYPVLVAEQGGVLTW